MHTEHLNNVRIGYVLGGWLLGVAATSFFLFVLIALNLTDAEGRGSGWITMAVALGFLLGGAFVGFLTALAPILHGILIGFTTLLAWAVINAVVTLFFPDLHWTSLTATATINVILVQVICAILGARFGYRYAVARNEP
jgi:hypothetical protein